jgi:hypothetical protein
LKDLPVLKKNFLFNFQWSMSTTWKYFIKKYHPFTIYP